MSGILQTLFLGAVATVKDAYFNLVTLLLNTTSTNGAQNNTFLDSSSNNFTITRNGNTTQGTFSPFSQTGWGNFFNGSSDYLTASNAAFVATGDFTVEAWVYGTQTGAFQGIFVSSDGADTAGFRIAIENTNALGFWLNGTSNTGTTFLFNQWNHVAMVRSGTGTNNVSCYFNGTRVAQFTNTSSTTNSAIAIGRYRTTGTNQYWLGGFVSNARLVVGSAVYSGATITVPTAPLSAITNTVFLTCQSNRFVDNSGNNYTITTNGTPSVQAFSPFAPTTAYSTSTVGGSGYFDGSGDYLTAPTNAAFAYGSGDFTIECWVYATAALSSGFTGIVGTMAAGGGLIGGTNTYIQFNVFGTANGVKYNSPLPTNTWVHLAYSRSGTTGYLVMNGVQVATGADSNNYSATSNFCVGSVNAGQYFSGYISGLRYVKGTALYTGATYTVPTAPPTAITNTQLLLNYTNAGIYDAAAKNDLETVGNAQVSTTQAKFGTTSISAVTGTSYLLTNPGQNLEFGTGSFTIEFWWYPVSTTRQALYVGSFGTDYSVAIDYSSVSTNQKIGIWASSTGSSWNLINADPGGNGIGTTTVTQNAWNHIAFVRNGSTWMLFVNGNKDLNITGIPDPIVNRSTYQKGIGVWWSPSTVPNPQTGYIDEFRITKGYARYTANFTPPTAAFPVQ